MIHREMDRREGEEENVEEARRSGPRVERGIRRSRRRSEPLIKALAPNESSIYLPPTRR